MTNTKVLVVDKELAIRKLLEIGLSSYGYDVITKSNAKEALASAFQQNPNMILLDVNLEEPLDGLKVCRQLCEWNKTPVIILTERDEKPIRLAAFDAGADDYVIKPFDMDELEARIRAILRRTATEAAPLLKGSEIRIHDLVIDLANRRVILAGEYVHLTPKEYELLRILTTQPGRVLTFHMLLEGVWGKIDTSKTEHNVHVYINNIRRKLKDNMTNNHKPRYIYSEPGIGYRFASL